MLDEPEGLRPARDERRTDHERERPDLEPVDLSVLGISDAEQVTPEFLAERLQHVLAGMVSYLAQAMDQAPDAESGVEIATILSKVEELQAETVRALTQAGLVEPESRES